MHGDVSSFEGRTVSLVSEKTTAWQAIQLFCNCAALHEWDGIATGLPAQVNLPADGPQTSDGMIVLGQMQVRRGQVSAVTANVPANRNEMIEKSGPVLATHRAGGANPCDAPGNGISGRRGQRPFARFTHLRGASAARGRSNGLTHRSGRGRARTRAAGKPIWADLPDVTDDWPRGARIPQHLTARKHGPVAIRFGGDDDPPRRLRELAGVVTIQAFAAERAVETAWPAHAVRQTARGGGVMLSFMSFTENAGREFGVTAEVELPYGTRLDQPVAGLVGFAGRGGFGRNLIGFSTEPELAAVSGSDYQGLSIEDAAGRPFPAATGAV